MERHHDLHVDPTPARMKATTGMPSIGRPTISRHLIPSDVPALLRLELQQWDETQAADARAMQERMLAYPELCVGTFCGTSGEALCSLFMRPVEREIIFNVRSWDECAGGLMPGQSSSSRSLFGISMTSIDPEALRSMEAYIWPQLLERGWREIFLGSPMPGLLQALRQDPTVTVNDYARGRRRNLPRDVQLRYYHQKGLTDIISVLPGYFPHPESLDYGALLRGDLAGIAARVCDVSRHIESGEDHADEAQACA